MMAVAGVCRHLRKYLNEDIVKELVGDAHAIAELEKEWEQLGEDRSALRQIFPSGESKVCLISLPLFHSTVLDDFFLVQVVPLVPFQNLLLGCYII